MTAKDIYEKLSTGERSLLRFALFSYRIMGETEDKETQVELMKRAEVEFGEL